MISEKCEKDSCPFYSIDYCSCEEDSRPCDKKIEVIKTGKVIKEENFDSKKKGE